MSLQQVNVSVIVPVYNVQYYLDKCIRSILAQTYGNFELILVDDGSTDGSPQICDDYALRDSRISVIHKANGGLSSARNAGLDIASGKYLYFVDSDDYIEPLLLEKTVAVMEQHHYDWCAFAMLKEDTQGDLIEKIAFKPAEIRIHTQEERMAFLLKYLLNYRMGWEACSHMYRGEIIRENHLRFVSERTVFAEDLLFSFTYWLYAASCVVIEDPLYHYIQRTDSLMEKSRFQNVLPRIHTLAEAACQAVEAAGLTSIREDFSILYLHLMEWHTRRYVIEKGLPWVREELAKIDHSAFWPAEPSAFRNAYQQAMQKYGHLDGAVTVVIPVPVEGSAVCLSSFLEQTLQKLDILLLTSAPVELLSEDPRVRQAVCRDLTPSGILRAAFAESWGEYLYFADASGNIPPRFLEILSDTAKYNDCGTVICTPAQPVFYASNSLSHRREFRSHLRTCQAAAHSALIRRDLLEQSGLKCMDDLREYMADILLSEHIIFTNGGLTDE